VALTLYRMRQRRKFWSLENKVNFSISRRITADAITTTALNRGMREANHWRVLL